MTEEHTSEAVREAVAFAICAQDAGPEGCVCKSDGMRVCPTSSAHADAALAALSAMGRVVVPSVAAEKAVIEARVDFIAALEEAARRYPGATTALTFVLGTIPSPVRAEDIEWAKARIAALAASPMAAPPHDR